MVCGIRKSVFAPTSIILFFHKTFCCTGRPVLGLDPGSRTKAEVGPGAYPQPGVGGGGVGRCCLEGFLQEWKGAVGLLLNCTTAFSGQEPPRAVSFAS